ncbi:MAG: ABC transporter permease subunit, partial [Clostridia bacterium]|nr:ABC transporter permease subunit [Clostridia bacterium]
MDFAGKFKVFWELFIEKEGWVRVVSVGLVNTLMIAILGLLIGIVIGTLIAAVKVMPKYKRWVRILDKICTVYVGFFRGTPLVVQLLITYYVMWPLL